MCRPCVCTYPLQVLDVLGALLLLLRHLQGLLSLLVPLLLHLVVDSIVVIDRGVFVEGSLLCLLDLLPRPFILLL